MTYQPALIDPRSIPEDVFPVVQVMCDVARDLANTIARGPLGQKLDAEVGQNSDGDNQKALDVLADDAFCDALRPTSVRWYASEERDDVIELNPQGDYTLTIDPLDGSSNIDVNVSIGTIFSILNAHEDPAASVLRPANEQLAAGYIIYGPQTAMVVTFGNGVSHYILDPETNRFELVTDALTMPDETREFAINASNYRHWSKPVRAYIDDCLAGVGGPRERNFNMRWVASLVAETHRILTRGGIFLYPSDGRDGYEHGRLRMVYECAPIAMIIEQAGGKASDGCDPIMTARADELHARTPLVFGTTEEVNRVCAYHDLPEEEVSALFGRRGLFRA